MRSTLIYETVPQYADMQRLDFDQCLFFFSSEQNLFCMPLIAKDDRRCLIAENVLAPDCRYFSVQLALDIFDIFSRYFSANIYQPHLRLMMHEVH